MRERPLREVLEAHAESLLAPEGVTGVAEGRTPDDKPCILVLVERNPAAVTAKLPSRVEGYPVEIRVSGRLEARDDSSA